jgi:hypothetical protein
MTTTGPRRTRTAVGLDGVVDQLSRELPDRDRDDIEHAVAEAAAPFDDATVTAFVPVLVLRAARSALGRAS